MEKTININEKEFKFKSSAATNILYKKLFRQDILIQISDYAKNSKELVNIQERIKAIRSDESKTQEEILSEINSCMNSEAFKATNEFSYDTLPKLAYIMYLEANETQETIFKKLTEEQYLFWLMSIDQDELISITGEVIALWKSGAKVSSIQKN